MKDYIKEAIKTNSCDYEEIRKRFTDEKIDMLHAVIGLTTETGELADNLKKHIFYGKEIDYRNMKEEIGDLFWYLAVICERLDISFEKIQEMNIEKLRKRYGESFTKEKALSRNIETELSHIPST